MEANPKYKIGDKLKVAHWGGETEPLTILDIQQTYHNRLEEYVWGYKMDGNTHLTMEYIPEGYLRPANNTPMSNEEKKADVSGSLPLETKLEMFYYFLYERGIANQLGVGIDTVVKHFIDEKLLGNDH